VRPASGLGQRRLTHRNPDLRVTSIDQRGAPIPAARGTEIERQGSTLTGRLARSRSGQKPRQCVRLIASTARPTKTAESPVLMGVLPGLFSLRWDTNHQLSLHWRGPSAGV